MASGSAAGVRVGRPRSQERRAAILAAAGDLMMEGGLKAATMEAIAARAGVGKATLYKWWPSRGAVALEGFMLRAADSWTLPEDVSAQEGLRVLAVAAVRLFTRTPAGPLMRALAADAQSDPEIAQALREQWMSPRRAVAAEVLRQGMASGELRADLDVEATLDLVFAPVYYRLLFSHEPLDESFAEACVAQVMTGVAAPGNNPAPPHAHTERNVQ
ncbi:TetR/AcrR family transcriptional regulator [Actinacidiphila guanduensis]|jgi:AcrR family transcriptional regulator|uniref:Transcriptional regulator, TetR family n=1 Tax=Actinacidiphila guanduensis TaxID=310781 RepID=A0A1G9V7J5_9ACTN|nr:TetR/AcrR family transcriptional regulator [Actinacidiphila guanduensis]SDM68129.1 transcriptional regulator, TetR family [Actinacidiphila guanduensis]